MSLLYNNYETFKNQLDTEIYKAAESFVKIGYLLKIARDTNILQESEYTNVNDFAKAQYGLDKSQVSRFISINERFSKDGSEELQDNFKGFGHAKLAIMLQLPEALNEAITPSFSKSDIQIIHDEVKKEREISDIEVMLEKENIASDTNDILYGTLLQLGMDEAQLFKSIFDVYKKHGEGKASQTIEKDLEDILVPNGEKLYSLRIPKVGRMMLTLKVNDAIIVTNIRSNESSTYTWQHLRFVWDKITDYTNLASSAESRWEELYDMEFPQKEEVAPVQLQKEKVKVVESKKKVPKPPKKAKPNAAVELVEVIEAAEQLPGQVSVDDIEGVVPEEVVQEIEERVEKVEEVEEAFEEDEDIEELREEAIRINKMINMLLTDHDDIAQINISNCIVNTSMLLDTLKCIETLKNQVETP